MWPFNTKSKKEKCFDSEIKLWTTISITGQHLPMYFKEFNKGDIPENHCYLKEFYRQCTECKIITFCKARYAFRALKTVKERKEHAKEMLNIIGRLPC